MSVEDIKIRKANGADLAAIARVWHTSWHVSEGRIHPTAAQSRDLDWFEAHVSTNKDRMIVAERSGEIVGFVGWEGNGVDQVFVLPGYFGKGVAQLLLNAVEEVLTAEGYQTLWLHCAEGNGRARRFYEKRGWQVIREFDVEMRTSGEPVPARAWHMEKNF